MTQPKPDVDTTLTIRRTLAAPRDLVFRAWTEPDRLKQWWAAGEAFSTPIAEVDLRVGGAFRLGMLAPGEDNPFIVGGIYQEVRRPEKLVYTWVWEAGHDMGPPSADFRDMLVTVEFNDLGRSTEVVLTHEYFPDQHARDEHNQGWEGCLVQLARLLEGART